MPQTELPGIVKPALLHAAFDNGLRRATPEKVSAIVRLKAQGLTWRVIAQRVGLPRGTCANVASRVRRGLLENSLDTKGSDSPSTDPVPT